MKFAFAAAAAAALVVAAPASAAIFAPVGTPTKVTTKIDFSSLSLGTFTSAVFGDYRITNAPGYGSGTQVFAASDGTRVLGDIIPEGDGSGFILTRLDGGLFDLDSATFGTIGAVTGRVILATYSGRDVPVAILANGQVSSAKLANLPDMFVDANLFTGTGGLGVSSLTVSATAAVPEPASWALMLVGFGAIGGAMRYRRRATRVRFA